MDMKLFDQTANTGRNDVNGNLGRTSSSEQTGQKNLSVVVLRTEESLVEYVTAWEDLAEQALEPNVFYEPWMLLPAIRFLGKGKDLRFVLIVGDKHTAAIEPRVLYGFFAIERKSRYKEAPVSFVQNWKHQYCFLGTPLLRTGYAKEALATFFDWAAKDRWSGGLVEFKYITGDGPFYQALIDEVNRRRYLTYLSESFTRALFKLANDSKTYLRETLSSKRRHECRRQTRRLSEMGRLEMVELDPQGDIQQWAESFLLLEASGWKGKEGSAMASQEATKTFFLTMATEGFRRGRLSMLGMRLDGQMIAQKCNLLSGPGGFAFKIGYDEQYASYSPGLQLEVEHIERLHQQPRTQWIDSCAAADHFMANLLWKNRRTINTVLVSTGKWPGDAMVTLLPLRRWLWRKLANMKLVSGDLGF